jgi:hypothetical protein
MTTMKQLPLEPIRQAVISGEFDRAQRLWNDCAAELAGQLGSGCLTEAMLAEVRALVEWSRVAVLCERAHLQNQLDRLQTELHVAGEYELSAQLPGHRIVAASF